MVTPEQQRSNTAWPWIPHLNRTQRRKARKGKDNSSYSALNDWVEAGDYDYDYERKGPGAALGGEKLSKGYLAITISIVSSRLWGSSSSASTEGVAVGVSSEAAGWPVAASLVLWNLTLTILLTPCSCMVMP